MTNILRSLEPRLEFEDTIIHEELDDMTEVLFFNKGIIDIGFEINRRKKFPLRKYASITIADQGCTFDLSSEFIYKAAKCCEGFSIRKNSW